MIDLYLRAEGKEALLLACPFLRDEHGGIASAGEGFAADVIGPLVTEPAVLDAEGNETKPAVIDGRFHVNLRCLEEIEQMVPEELRVLPDNPRRVWL